MHIEPSTPAPVFYWTPGSPELTPEPSVIRHGDKEFPATPEQVASYDRLVARYGTPPDEITLMILGDGCLLTRWGGLWIGIEKDGYAHS